MDEKQKNLPEHYSAKHIGSFAYLTIKDRLPIIVVKVIDTLCQRRNEIIADYGESATEEIKEIIGRLSGLQYEMTTNKPIKPIEDDSADTPAWNMFLEKQKEMYDFQPAWFDSSWLYAECYFYRRISQAFKFSSVLKDYDPFHKQKEESFFSMMDAVISLCSALNGTIAELKNCNKETDKFTHIRRYFEASLWGNKFDLSISAGKENISNTALLSELDQMRENIIVNQSEDVYQLLQDLSKKKEKVTIDFVLDNAGFELYCDLCFLQILSHSKLVNVINIYPKVIPWFVSDTLEKDIDWLLQTLEQGDQESLANFSRDCRSRFESGEWRIVNELFWTQPHDFSEMPSVDPQLYKRLSENDLVIFKGDLNYRKLTGDRQWHETETLKTTMNGFLPTNVASLRTIKADVVVGLKPNTSSNLAQGWKLTGNYAVIQYCPSET